MNPHGTIRLVAAGLAVLASSVLPAGRLQADSPYLFSTGGPDGRLASGAVIPTPGLQEIETADDFALSLKTTIKEVTFTGLLPLGLPLTSVQDVSIGIYRVFPKDSLVPPSGNVPTRTNSPSDVEFTGRDASGGSLSFTTDLINPSFTAGNSVVNGIHPIPGQLTNGEGPVTGQEVTFHVTLTTPVTLDPDHYFFVPQVQLNDGQFLWLSAPKPITPPGTPFVPDLQTWIRNADLSPDWLRVGTDVIGSGTYNASFTLSGTTVDSTVPDGSALALLLGGLMPVGFSALRARRRSA
ncbi:MAG TPA: PEP-CTERM sorting domain-containing protein [Armatimonadota bacterium]|jgi:hypothetical protein